MEVDGAGGEGRGRELKGLGAGREGSSRGVDLEGRGS